MDILRVCWDSFVIFLPTIMFGVMVLICYLIYNYFREKRKIGREKNTAIMINVDNKKLHTVTGFVSFISLQNETSHTT